MYYLAYGMNTNRAAMRQRCPKAKPMGGFYLPNYRLIFRGVADFRAGLRVIRLCMIVGLSTASG